MPMFFISYVFGPPLLDRSLIRRDFRDVFGGCADLDKPISTADLCCRGFGGTYYMVDGPDVLGQVETVHTNGETARKRIDPRFLRGSARLEFYPGQ